MSNQYGIKEVLNSTFYDFTTGAELFYADYMTDGTFETSAERLDIKGGMGNYKLLSFDHSKTMNYKAELPLVDMRTLALLSGKALNVGAVIINKREVLTTVTTGTPTVTLAATPTAGSIKAYLVSGRDVGVEQTEGTPGTTVNKWSLSGAILTFNNTTAPAGTTVAVSYTYTTAATAKTTTFTADKFPGYVRILGTGLIVDQVTGAEVVSVFDIKKAKPKNNWSITHKSDAATVLTLDFDLYSVDVGTDKVYVTMTALT